MGSTTAVPGTPITYTIVAANAGPFNATGAIVQDTLPAALTGATWTCTGSAGGSCVAATGSGSIDSAVNLPAGGSVTFLVSATIDAAASGILVNTATISPPADVADHDPSNDTATDTTTLTPEADLSITKNDGQTAAVAGSTAVYTIVASNAGPSSAIGATIADPLPTGALGSTWSCTATTGSACGSPSGAGALATTADIAPSGSVTYTVSVQIDPSAQGSFSNTATVEMATGGTDTDASNNSATDTDQLRAEGTLTLTKTHTTSPVVAGAAIQYVLVAGNAGPSTARGVRVLDPLPPDLLGATWTCTAPAGSACAPATGTGDVDVVLDLLPGANATITVDATLDPAAAGTLSNAATLVVPGDFTSLAPAAGSGRRRRDRPRVGPRRDQGRSNRLGDERRDDHVRDRRPESRAVRRGRGQRQ